MNYYTSSWAVALFATAVSAQSQIGETDLQAASIIRQAHGLEVDGERLRGGGADYEVVCAEGAMTFIPALGRGAPRAMPWTYELQAIARGDEVVLEAGPAVGKCEDATAIYARYGGIEERFAVRPDGVEISYVFPTRPAGRGDLVVRAHITTDLEATDADGVRYECAGFGGVAVGAVTGIDASGERVVGSLRRIGSTLELSLPSEFVDAASYPLVLDPLVGTIFDAAAGFDDTNGDVASIETPGRFLVVWERAFSQSNVQIRGQLVDEDGSLSGSFFAVTAGSAVSLNPAVASIRSNDRFLVVWQEGTTVFGPFNIRCMAVSANGTRSNRVFLADQLNESTADPDVAGNASPFDTESLVVWSNGQGLRGMTVEVPSSGDPSPVSAEFVYTTDPSDANPAIGAEIQFGLNQLIVFERDDPDREIFALDVDNNGTVFGAPARVTSNALDDTRPRVDGSGADFLIVYEREESPGGTRDVLCQSFNLSTGAGPVVAIESDAGQDEVEPDVVLLGDKFLVAWSDQNGASFLSNDLVMRAISRNGCVACGPEITIPTSRHVRLPAIARIRGFGPTGARAIVVFSEFSTVGSFDGDLTAQMFDEFGSGGSSIVVAPACGGAGSTVAAGRLSIGDRVDWELSGFDPGITLAILGLNIPNGGLLACGPCTFMPVIASINVPVVGNTLSAGIEVPCDFAAVGVQVDGQWIVAQTAATPCSILPNISTGDIVRVTVGL